jgi:hypothetical protein
MKAKTEKIRVTVRREEVKEIEISFPYYTRNEGLYCKFFSEDDAIWVYDYGLNRGVKCSNCVPEIWKTNDPITEKEFNAKFNEVMTALIDINNEKTI